MLAAGIPYTTPMLTVNRFCATGLIAVNVIANRIRAGEIGIGLAVGLENMSVTWVVMDSIFECFLIPFLVVFLLGLLRRPDNGAPKMGDAINSSQIAKDSLQVCSRVV